MIRKRRPCGWTCAKSYSRRTWEVRLADFEFLETQGAKAQVV